eukprot:CAMPEP_0171067644 /NCGR_PEP_ID=MMETSP0766_2-20121228/8111_1 /TAXON_ID=439317 /ORGANISM="Gambierdiscus australes, Strain CAWD 149" /LENGTH=407 /DNA_ID=CAMNT_0011523897 /DNA_START=78 /DNA_END=1301 /DNA_ORIENTATION=-
MMGNATLSQEAYLEKFGGGAGAVGTVKEDIHTPKPAEDKPVEPKVEERQNMATVVIMFNYREEKWSHRFSVEKGTTALELKRRMLKPGGPEDDLVSFSLKKGMIRVWNFETIDSDETFEFQYCGPEEGQRFLDRDNQRKERDEQEALARAEEERKKQEERARQDEERRRLAEEREAEARREEERKKEEARREEERKQELARFAEERRREEERKREEEARLVEERRREEQRKKEEALRLAEEVEQRRKEEQRRREEALRLAEEEEQRRREEEARLEEERRIEEQRRREEQEQEEQRRREEQEQEEQRRREEQEGEEKRRRLQEAKRIEEASLQEFEVTIHIDRSLDFQTNLVVKGATLISAVKERLAADDPTGLLAPSDFAFVDPASGRELDDSEQVLSSMELDLKSL